MRLGCSNLCLSLSRSGLIQIELEKLWAKGAVLTYCHTAIWARDFNVTFKQADNIVVELAGEHIVREVDDLQAVR